MENGGVVEMNRTQSGALDVYHDVVELGDGVLSEFVSLIPMYAGRVGLSVEILPPVTLSGELWDRPWAELSGLRFAGNAGPEWGSKEQYRCLFFMVFQKARWNHKTPDYI